MKTTYNLKSLLLTLTGIAILSGVELKAQTQAPNPGFELVNDTVPQDWDVSDYGAGLSNYSNTGNHSIAVWNWYYYANGYTVNGSMNSGFNFAKAGTPISGKPLKMTAFYWYDTTNTLTENDSAIASVLLKKNNSSTQLHDTIGYGITKLPATGNGFVPFEVIINDWAPGIDPDSIVIMFKSSSVGFCSNNSNGTCLYLYVDDINLEFSLGANEIENEKQFGSVYPNPVSDQLFLDKISNEITSVKIKDVSGRIMREINPAQLKSIDVSAFHSGLYLVEMYIGTEIANHMKFIKN